MGIPIPGKDGLYIETGPWMFYLSIQVEEFLTEKVVHSLLHLVLKKNHVLNAAAKKTVGEIYDF